MLSQYQIIVAVRIYDNDTNLTSISITEKQSRYELANKMSCYKAVAMRVTDFAIGSNRGGCGALFATSDTSDIDFQLMCGS